MKINLYKSITVAAAASFLFLLPAPAGAAEGLSGFQIPDSFSGGSGTLDDPYLIADAGQLALLSSLSNSEDYETRLSYSKASYLLTADIQLNDVSDFSEWENAAPENVWRAIGENGHFDGVFDGNGHTISGMYIHSDLVNSGSNTSGDGAAPGLFGNVYSGTITNVNLKDSLILIDGKPRFAGGLIAYAGKNCTVASCESSVVIQAGPDVTGIGGLIGNSCAAVSDCSFTGTLRLSDGCSAGGLIGTLIGDGFSVTSCRSEGVFEALEDLSDRTYAGGLFGHVSNGTDCVIESCSNASDLDLGGCRTAGIAAHVSLTDRDADLTDGENRPDGKLTITGCSNSGNIASASEEYAAAGIVGSVLGTESFTEGEDYIALTVDQCTNEGNISGSFEAAGIIGDLNSRTGWEIVSCKNRGSISASGLAAGILAGASACENSNRIQECTNSGSVFSEIAHAGGILGDSFGFSLYVQDEADAALHREKCRNDGVISGGSGILGLGGILGSVTSAESCVSINSCINGGELRCSGTARMGGILGDAQFSDLSSYSDMCYLISSCENHGNLIQGDGSLLFSEDNYTESAPSEEAIENYDAEGVGSAAFVLGGPAVGGIIGYSNNGGIEGCISTGTISLDSGIRPVFSHADLFNTAWEENAESGIVFTGAICGLYLFDDADDEAVTYLRNCSWSGPSPAGYYAAIYETGIEDVGPQA